MTRRPVRVVLTSLACALFCACAAIPPPRSPADAVRWLELHTEHFVVVTDAEEAEARSAAAEYEQGLRALHAAAFPRITSEVSYTLVLLRDEQEQRAVRPNARGADYLDRGRSDIERAPTFIVYGTRDRAAKLLVRETFLERLARLYIRQTFGDVPAWLELGLAEYLSTIRNEGGRLTFGRRPARLREADAAPIRVGDVLAFDRDSLSRDERRGWAAWALIHFFLRGEPAIRQKFRSLLEGLQAGLTPRDAWRTTLQIVPVDEIDRAFSEHVRALASEESEAPLPTAPAAPVLGARPLTDVDVHLLLARAVDPNTSVPDLRSEEALITGAAREAPASAEVSYRRGCRFLTHGFGTRGAREMESALSAAPDDPRYLFGALEAAATSAPPAEAQRELLEWGARLARTARSADEWSIVARIEAEDGRDAEALQHADRAVAADPASFAAYASRAFVHFHARRFGEAVADQAHALVFAADQSPTVEVRGQEHVLDVYREMQAGAPSRR